MERTGWSGTLFKKRILKGFRNLDHPGCAAEVASRLFVNGAATPPMSGGEQPFRPFIHAFYGRAYFVDSRKRREARNFEIDDKSIRLCLKGREWVGSETAPFPSVFKEGWRAAPGWLVKGRVASLYAREAILIFCRKTRTTPSAPLRNGVFLFVAQPPLGKEGNGTVSQPTIPPLPRIATCGTVLITNQFSIFICGLQFIHTFLDRAYSGPPQHGAVPRFEKVVIHF